MKQQTQTAAIQHLQQQDATMTTQINNQSALLTQLQQKVQACSAARVAFTAAMDAGFHGIIGNLYMFTFGTNQVVRFDKTLTNEGGDYHSSSGAFICRTPGLYSFTANMLFDMNDHSSIKLQLNGHEVTSAYALDKDHYAAASTTAAMHLQVGDVVTVFVNCAQCSVVQEHTYFQHANSFTGVLVQADA